MIGGTMSVLPYAAKWHGATRRRIGVENNGKDAHQAAGDLHEEHQRRLKSELGL
jgi:hypothetical protein